jgi:ABC-2 type transport system ATP-binding protein
LKRQIGSDVIVVHTGRGGTDPAVAALAQVAGLDRIETSGHEVLISVTNGAAAISPVAVALAEAGIQVEGLTLRTPTLDDVFLHTTGVRLQEDAA